MNNESFSLPGGGGGLPTPEMPNPLAGLTGMFDSLAYAANIAIIVIALIVGLIVLLLIIKIIMR